MPLLFFIFFFVLLSVSADRRSQLVRIFELIDETVDEADGFFDGVSQVDRIVSVPGEEVGATRLKDFCGRRPTVDFLRGVPDEKIRAILYDLDSPVSSNIHNITLTIPVNWFLDSTHGLRVLICLQGKSLRPTMPNQIHSGDYPRQELVQKYFASDEMTTKDEYIFLSFLSEWLQGDAVIGAALLFDNRWNQLIFPSESISLMIVRMYHLQKKITYTGLCDISKGRDQTCCRWPIYGMNGDGTRQSRILFHRCLESVPVQFFPLLTKREKEEAIQGGVLRIEPKMKICRESKTRRVEIRLQDSNRFDQHKAEEVIAETDALECQSV